MKINFKTHIQKRILENENETTGYCVNGFLHFYKKIALGNQDD